MNDHNKTQINEFIEKLQRIEGEIQLLNEEKKDLFDDYKNTFDPKVLREAIRTVKARIKLGDKVSQLDEVVNQLEQKLTF
jgi:uncharacterized protein (UPF0335 family)|tara:strand:- start:135 stop:374 length:240 start_codon:yes stop_codon:yes gene_type:complete